MNLDLTPWPRYPTWPRYSEGSRKEVCGSRNSKLNAWTGHMQLVKSSSHWPHECNCLKLWVVAATANISTKWLIFTVQSLQFSLALLSFTNTEILFDLKMRLSYNHALTHSCPAWNSVAIFNQVLNSSRQQLCVLRTQKHALMVHNKQSSYGLWDSAGLQMPFHAQFFQYTIWPLK